MLPLSTMKRKDNLDWSVMLTKKDFPPDSFAAQAHIDTRVGTKVVLFLAPPACSAVGIEQVILDGPIKNGEVSNSEQTPQDHTSDNASEYMEGSCLR